MNYPTGVPSPLVTHVHPYPTRFHGGIWKRPVFGMPYVRTPYAVFRPSQMMDGLGSSLDFDTANGVFRRPRVDGGGVFNQISGLGATNAQATAAFVGAAVVTFGIGMFLLRKK
jgi:hypothetical protein